MWYILLLAVGFLPLVYGANLLVNNASSLAKKLNIPAIVIGLTIVGFGTSSPEMVVNIIASIEKSSDLVLGNIIGSNLINVFGILGISAIIYPIAVRNNTRWIEIPLSLLSAVVIIILANDHIIDKTSFSRISRIDGLILLLFFLIFIVYNVRLAQSEGYTGDLSIKEKPLTRSVLLMVGGLALLIAGGRIIVTSAVKVATILGMSERVIALTIVSIGTSLPELATSVVAAVRRNTDIAIGNVVGSNIYNVFLILGVSATIYPVSLPHLANIDMLVNILASLLLLIFVFTGKERKLGRCGGIVFVIIYISYLLSVSFI
jgi:cation:H+ antiporter